MSILWLRPFPRKIHLWPHLWLAKIPGSDPAETTGIQNKAFGEINRIRWISFCVCQSQKQRINRIRWMEAALPTSLWNRRLHINSLSWARATSSVCAKLMLKFAQNKYPTGRVSFVRVTNSFWWTYLRSAAGSSLLACHPDVDPSKALLEWHLSFRAKHTSQRCKRLIA